MQILLVRGFDQWIFRGMDILGDELEKLGHIAVVSAPLGAMWDTRDYDVLIGNSQGAVVVMNRPVILNKNPKMIITVDVPTYPDWKAHNGVKHLNIYGTWHKAGRIKGAKNIFIGLNHLMLSYSEDMRQKVKEFIKNNA